MTSAVLGTADADTSQTVLITGAAGLIGRAAQSAFLDAGWKVRATDVVPAERIAVPERSAEVEVLELELLDLGAEQLRGIDAVVHLGALTLSAEFGVVADRVDARPMLETNVLATDQLFRLAVDASVGTVVYASAGAVYGREGDSDAAATGRARSNNGPFRPGSLYAHTKLMCEGLAAFYGARSSTAFLGIRPTFSYGRDRLSGISGALAQFIIDAMEGKPAVLPPPFGRSGSLQLIYVKDMAGSLVAAVERGQEGLDGTNARVLNSPTDELITVAEIVETLRTASGNDAIEVPQEHFSPEIQMPVMDTAESIDFLRFEQKFHFKEAILDLASSA